jgi:hypothetical protein
VPQAVIEDKLRSLLHEADVGEAERLDPDERMRIRSARAVKLDPGSQHPKVVVAAAAGEGEHLANRLRDRLRGKIAVGLQFAPTFIRWAH